MKTSFRKYGRLKGQDLCEITLTNDVGMEVKLLNYGATLESLTLAGVNMVLTLPKSEDYHQERNYLGGTIGRICGRIAKGEWKHGNEVTHLPLNEGENHVHGGLGIDTDVWNFQLQADETSARAVFTIVDYAGHNGFPGNLKVKVTYRLDNQNNLDYKIEALSDQMTIFNPANHTYFTLGERGADLMMKVAADYYLPVDGAGIPTDGMHPVAGTPFDFCKSRIIGDALAEEDEQLKLRNGFDHPFILNGEKIAAKLESHHFGLEFTTDAPAVVIYTGNHFDHSGICRDFGQYDAVTLEAQCPPVGDGNLQAITLLAGEKFERNCRYHFYQK